jgi:hypothetical protein
VAPFKVLGEPGDGDVLMRAAGLYSHFVSCHSPSRCRVHLRAMPQASRDLGCAPLRQSSQTVLTLAGVGATQPRERSRWSRRLAGVGRDRASARDGLDALRATAANARALETVLTPCMCRPRPRERSRRLAGVGRKRASARDAQDALRALAASARALETVLTPCGRLPQARERSRRS